MSYLEFDKKELVNLEYSLSRETIRTNRRGSFASSTIVGCNTRRYHGLLICPIFEAQRHVLLSSLDVTVVQEDWEFELGIHKYPGGLYQPKGHIYVKDFDTEPIPKLTYRIGDAELSREILLVEEEEKILARYTLLKAKKAYKLRLKPFLACREIHNLAKANMDVRSDFEPIKNGIRFQMYDNYPSLFMQSSRKIEYIPAPDWHYNIEYPEEQKRGYHYHEDLFVPGFFEIEVKQGDSFVFAVGLSESNPAGLKKLFDAQLKKRIPRDSFENCLINSAQQFLIKNGDHTDLIAGYPWFGQWARDTFIALPGLTLAIGDVDSCKAVLDSQEEEGALIANIDTRTNSVFNAADAPLWYCWAVQKYADLEKDKAALWDRYGSKIKNILEGYRSGLDFEIKMLGNGLIYAGVDGETVTWMDSKVDGRPVTPRVGIAVEINALWYNALCFALELAEKADDQDFIDRWAYLPEQIADSFVNLFWDPYKRYLADFVREEHTDWAVRPNQIFAVSLPYSPISDEMKRAVLDVVERELLTPKGLRTLSPKHPDYKGRYGGNPLDRDMAYHQGTVWPWLFGHYVEGYLNLYGKKGLDQARKLYLSFEEDMRNHGIGSISEIYDGNPPYRPNGAISQAWSVAEVLRVEALIKEIESKKG